MNIKPPVYLHLKKETNKRQNIRKNKTKQKQGKQRLLAIVLHHFLISQEILLVIRMLVSLRHDRNSSSNRIIHRRRRRVGGAPNRLWRREPLVDRGGRVGVLLLLRDRDFWMRGTHTISGGCRMRRTRTSCGGILLLGRLLWLVGLLGGRS